MFLGTHTPRLDDKGRLILPAKFRDGLAGGVVITKGQERCLYVFPTAEFTAIAEQLRQQSVANEDRAFRIADEHHDRWRAWHQRDGTARERSYQRHQGSTPGRTRKRDDAARVQFGTGAHQTGTGDARRRKRPLKRG